MAVGYRMYHSIKEMRAKYGVTDTDSLYHIINEARGLLAPL